MRNVVSVLSTVAAIAVGCVEYATSAGVLSGVFWFVVGGLFWPVTVGVWLARGLLLPYLRAHGVL